MKMKRIIRIGALFVLAGCAHHADPFVQGNIRIVPPVQIDPTIATYNEAGRNKRIEQELCI